MSKVEKQPEAKIEKTDEDTTSVSTEMLNTIISQNAELMARVEELESNPEPTGMQPRGKPARTEPLITELPSGNVRTEW